MTGFAPQHGVTTLSYLRTSAHRDSRLRGQACTREMSPFRDQYLIGCELISASSVNKLISVHTHLSPTHFSKFRQTCGGSHVGCLWTLEMRVFISNEFVHTSCENTDPKSLIFLPHRVRIVIMYVYVNVHRTTASPSI